jgi:dihydroorotase-like cyclic amidohydrolase
MWDAGATAFKMFTCETGCSMAGFLSAADQRRALRAVADVRAVVLVHAEDQAVLDENRAAMEADGHHAAGDFARWRSLDAELAAVRRVLRLAAEESATPYFVHCSAADVVDLIVQARGRGLRTWAETCPHYLWLSTDNIAEYGHRATTSPPVRDPARVEQLRTRIEDDVSVVGSDHGAVLPQRKDIDDAFLGQPGLPGNETMVVLMLELVARGELSLPRLVSLLAENPARIFGLARKGVIEPGTDGDLTLVDMAATSEIRAHALRGSAGWTPYEGLRVRGRVQTTVVRGVIVADDGELHVGPGHGRFVRRDA